MIRISHILSFILVFHCFNCASQDNTAEHYLEHARASISLFPDSAILYAQHAISTAGKNGYSHIEALAYGVIGEVHQAQSRLKESIEAYLKGIQIAENAGENTILPSLYNGLGISYYYIRDNEKSEYYIKKAAALKLEQGDYTWYSVILTNLAGLYTQQGKHKEALEMLTSSRDVLIRAGQEKYLTSLYNALGAAYQMGFNNLDSAATYYNRSLELAEKYTITPSLISGHYNLAEVAFAKREYELAISHLNSAETIASKLAPDRFLLEIYRLKSESLAAQGNFREALSYRTKQLALNDTLFNSEKQKAISELEIKYQTANRERELQEVKLSDEKKRGQLQILLFTALTAILLIAGIFSYLWQRKKMHAAMETEKNRIFENIVHEIRTPLTLINGPLQVIQKNLDNRPELSEQIHLARTNSERLSRLVAELLEASRLDKGMYTLHWQTGDIIQFVHRIAEMYRTEAASRQIILHVEVSPETKLCTYPTNGLEHILSNLINNAIKYSEEGTRIGVLFKCDDSEARLTVTDNGPGIPAREQSRIFERFYRMSNHSAKPGTGIGLSMVKEIVRLAGGTVSLRSEPGHGSEFTVNMPIRQASQNEDVVVLAEDANDTRPVILLVEDDEGIARFVTSLLSADFQILQASNGLEGLRMSEANIPDLILTDIIMPGMDGVSMMQELKSNDLTSHIPVVVFSARTSLESRLNTLRYGADAYIPKPFNADELHLVIQNLLTTIRRNQDRFRENLNKAQPAEERLKSTSSFVNDAVNHILRQLDNGEYGVQELASDMALSRSQLHRKLTNLTGFSGTYFIRMVRLEKAADMLRTTDQTITEVAYACGFNSQSYFTRSFTEHFGENPSAFAQKPDN